MGLYLKVQSLGFRGHGIQDSMFRIEGLRFMVKG